MVTLTQSNCARGDTTASWPDRYPVRPLPGSSRRSICGRCPPKISITTPQTRHICRSACRCREVACRSAPASVPSWSWPHGPAALASRTSDAAVCVGASRSSCPGQDLFVLTDAGPITMIIGGSVSLILIVIGELLQEEDRAVNDQQALGHDIVRFAHWSHQRLSPNASTRSLSSGGHGKVYWTGRRQRHPNDRPGGSRCGTVASRGDGT